jgi:aspartyl-tRNA(Asn)/glutamyl-tRNA(Gln) amidotransferase subunit A
VAQLHELTVAQAAAAIRNQELSPVALVEALLQRIDATDGKLQAWAYVARDQALEVAREAEREVTMGSALSPMFGVPFAAKDIFDTAGIPTEAGSDHYKGRVPTKDAAPIARFKQAGAILLGKVHTTELADGHPAPSKNPHNLDHSPGGSSAGSAAAVGACTVPIALGSQTVGSTLRPAAFCGVVGFKPTFGRVNRNGVVPMSRSLDHVGWLARSVEDVAIALQVLAGYDASDPHLIDVPVDDYVGAVDKADKPPRIGLLHYYFEKAEETMRRSALAALERLAKAGAAVDEVRLDVDFDATFKAHRAIQGPEMASWHKQEGLLAHMERYKSGTRAALERALSFSGVDYYDGKRLRQATREQLRGRLQEVDVLVSPTTSAPAPALSANSTGDPAWQSPWTLIGFPSITLPTGQTPTGLPTGLQLGGPAWQEAKLLGVARWAERALGVRMPVPTI